VTCRVLIGGTVGEVAIEALLRSLHSGGIDLTRIEPPALLLVLEEVVSSRLGSIYAEGLVGVLHAADLIQATNCG
jgi:hypothetical protein